MDFLPQFTFDDIIRYGIAWVVILSSLLSIVYIIWWWFLMIVSGWKEEKIKPAVNHIRHAIIGLVFLLSILFVFPVFMNLVGLPYWEYAKPKTVFSTMSEIMSIVFWTQWPTDDTLPASSDLPDDFSSDF
jgi:hypothetical protein